VPHVIEDFVPYDRSALWRIQDAYFAARGAAAWQLGEIPCGATSNFAIARQHAALVLEVVRELEAAGGLAPHEPFFALEVGSGLGTFAANFFRALETGSGPEGTALAARLRYVLSDYAESAVRQAINGPTLAPLAASGRLIPAVLDLRAPGAPRGLDGRAVEARFAVLFANYVCCAIPPKIVRKTRDGFFEKRLSLRTDLDDGDVLAALARRAGQPGILDSVQIVSDWAPVDLDRLFGAPVHAAALGDALARLPEATASYPEGFLDFLRAVRGAVLPGALALVTDFGLPAARDLRGIADPLPKRYGNSFSHPVAFALVEAFCAREGLALARTRSPLRALHTVAIRFAPEVPDSFTRAFRATHVARRDGERLVDLMTAGRLALQVKDWFTAARLYRRALRLDPAAPDILFPLGVACLEAGLGRQAVRALRRGLALDLARAHDFLFHLGRAWILLERFEDARRALEEVIAARDRADAQASLAVALEKLGDGRGAYRAYRRALALEPDGERADAIRRRLVDALVPADAPPAHR
jgi:tetratricopeptide (TPR) repeat protein